MIARTTIAIAMAFTLIAAPACAHHSVPTEVTDNSAAEAQLLELARQWVDTWNGRDADAMEALQSKEMTYAAFGNFMSGPELLTALRDSNFFGLQWTIVPSDMKARLLTNDIALVTYRLEGDQISKDGRTDYKSIFTMIYRRTGEGWEIVHVHDSDGTL